MAEVELPDGQTHGTDREAEALGPVGVRRRLRVDSAHPEAATARRAPGAQGPPAEVPGLGAAAYEVIWSASALQVVVLMGHFVGVILFAVDDRRAVVLSLVGFSLFVWGLSGLYLMMTVVTHLTHAPTPSPSWGQPPDDYLDVPDLDGAGADPRPGED